MLLKIMFGFEGRHSYLIIVVLFTVRICYYIFAAEGTKKIFPFDGTAKRVIRVRQKFCSWVHFHQGCPSGPLSLNKQTCVPPIRSLLGSNSHAQRPKKSGRSDTFTLEAILRKTTRWKRDPRRIQCFFIDSPGQSTNKSRMPSYDSYERRYEAFLDENTLFAVRTLSHGLKWNDFWHTKRSQ